jgi:hypothetical protein
MDVEDDVVLVAEGLIGSPNLGTQLSVVSLLHSTRKKTVVLVTGGFSASQKFGTSVLVVSVATDVQRSVCHRWIESSPKTLVWYRSFLLLLMWKIMQ